MVVAQRLTRLEQHVIVLYDLEIYPQKSFEHALYPEIAARERERVDTQRCVKVFFY